MADNNPSVLLHGPKSSSISTTFLPVPTLSSYPPDYVLLRISYVGVCGSDVHFYLHGGVGSDPRKYAQHFCSQNQDKANGSVGLVMGHEATATVLETGSGVNARDLVSGDRVAIEPGVPCRTCVRCAEGMYNLCADMRFAASFFEEPLPSSFSNGLDAGTGAGSNDSSPVMGATPGTLCKYYVLPASLCYKLPENISLQEGVLIEPLAVAVHAARLVGVNPMTQTVLITGAGTVGLLIAAVCCAYGAAKIILIDVETRKLKFAQQWLCSEGGAAARAGAEVKIFDSSAVNGQARDIARQLQSEFRLGVGVDAAVEASGSPSATALAIFALRPGGTMVQTGLSKTPTMDGFPIVDLSEKEIRLTGAFRYKNGDFAVARDLLGRGLVGPVGRLISKIWLFEEYEEAWRATMQGKGEGTKNIIEGVLRKEKT